jgi:hypothetical protein
MATPIIIITIKKIYFLTKKLIIIHKTFLKDFNSPYKMLLQQWYFTMQINLIYIKISIKSNKFILKIIHLLIQIIINSLKFCPKIKILIPLIYSQTKISLLIILINNKFYKMDIKIILNKGTPNLSNLLKLFDKPNYSKFKNKNFNLIMFLNKINNSNIKIIPKQKDNYTTLIYKILTLFNLKLTSMTLNKLLDNLDKNPLNKIIICLNNNNIIKLNNLNINLPLLINQIIKTQVLLEWLPKINFKINNSSNNIIICKCNNINHNNKFKTLLIWINILKIKNQ